jgi:hypothetical protein
MSVPQITLDLDDTDCSILIAGYVDALQSAVEDAVVCADVLNWPDWELAVAESQAHFAKVVELLRVHRNYVEASAAAERQEAEPQDMGGGND